MGDGLKRASKAARVTRAPVSTDLFEYEVDGGRVLDEMSGVSRIDLVGEELGHGSRRAITLFIPRDELALYPIGAKVRVTVARVK
jgi:hypothetical protein